MTIPVTGGTGTVGAHAVGHRAGQGVAVRALTRSPDRARFPDGVVPIPGDRLDVAAMRAALSGAGTPFPLDAVPGDAEEREGPLGRPLRTDAAFARETLAVRQD